MRGTVTISYHNCKIKGKQCGCHHASLLNAAGHGKLLCVIVFVLNPDHHGRAFQIIIAALIAREIMTSRPTITPGKLLHLISVYAPTMTHSDENKFHEDLSCPLQCSMALVEMFSAVIEWAVKTPMEFSC
ncbi:unnamed protein product [Arctia plantaginis]|uniref:Uncharacterized protein n=1 Tax=Arctia plantaginis TaxID=874455 RepID=A0A8S1BJ23_ARCPL|nr:unnamed protein product [Arctia plantaginis]